MGCAGSKAPPLDPMLLAVKAKDLNQVNSLAQDPATFDVNATDKEAMTALHFAARSGTAEIMGVLLKVGGEDRKGGYDLEAKTKDGFTPLILAAVNAFTDVVELLVKAGADVTATDSEGKSAHDWAKKELKRSGSALSVHGAEGQDKALDTITKLTSSRSTDEINV